MPYRFNLIIVLLSVFIVTACGGSSGGETPPDTSDTDAPSGYNIAFSESSVDDANIASTTLSLTGLETQASYIITLRDNSDQLSYSGTVDSSSLTVDAADLNSLANGRIDASLTLTDPAGNTGAAATAFTNKETTQQNVNITGIISYDYVPNTRQGLNYLATEPRAARGITVHLLDRNDATIAQTKTDAQGNYTFTVLTHTQVRIRALAEITQSSPSYNFKVTDNTQDNRTYVIQGALSSSGATNASRDLHAESGWGGSRYTEERAAAPFAIIDTIYTSIQPLILAAGEQLSMPAAQLRWSTRNRATVGDDTNGDITTSKFVPSQSAVYILGSENNDTDEYDAHVVAHEFGHYVDFALSRSDSIGGGHSLNEELDMRVAFGEGYANAFSAIVLGDPLYLDSLGRQQAFSQQIDISGSNIDKPGWFNEGSVQEIVYTLYDQDQEIFNDIYATLTSNSYKNATALTSIHLFAATFKQIAPELSDRIDELAGEQDIVVDDIWGSNETNDGGIDTALPIYKTLVVGGGPATLCSTKVAGEINKLGNIQHARTTISSAGRYRISVQRESGIDPSDPDFFVFQNGETRGGGVSDDENSEELNEGIILSAGEALIEVYEYSNTDNNMQTGGTVCFNVLITRA